MDTLEQCISVIIEKIQRLDQERNGSRMSSIDYNKANEGEISFYCNNILSNLYNEVCEENFMLPNIWPILSLKNVKNRQRILIYKRDIMQL